MISHLHETSHQQEVMSPTANYLRIALSEKDLSQAEITREHKYVRLIIVLKLHSPKEMAMFSYELTN